MKKKKTLFILLFILIILILFWKLNVFSVDKIEVSSNAECIADQVLKNEISSVGKNLLNLKSDQIKNELISKYLCVKDIDISYQFPRTIKITVYGRNFLTKVFPLAEGLNLLETEASSSSETALLDWSFPTESSDDAFVADNTGYIFTKKPQSFSLPVIYLPENLTIGKQLDMKRFNFIEQVFEKYPQINSISGQYVINAKISGNTLLINDSPKVAFFLGKRYFEATRLFTTNPAKS